MKRYIKSLGTFCYAVALLSLIGCVKEPTQVMLINNTHLEMVQGNTWTLVVRVVSPSNITSPNVIWSSSNESVATVSSSGVVTAKSAGSATITVKTSDGKLSAACQVTVNSSFKITTGSENGFEWVDLGLPSGLKWATCNLGAYYPTGYGNYYAWGETALKSDYSWSTYKWYNPSSKTQKKYNTTVDNKTVLDLDDDAAHVELAGGWRIPTNSEWRELSAKCTWTWTTINGTDGRLVTGPNGNSIFLPAAGYREGNGRYDVGWNGHYWSSSLDPSYYITSPNMYYAYSMDFNANYVSGSYPYIRRAGLSVRPVTK